MYFFILKTNHHDSSLDYFLCNNKWDNTINFLLIYSSTLYRMESHAMDKKNTAELENMVDLTVIIRYHISPDDCILNGGSTKPVGFRGL